MQSELRANFMYSINFYWERKRERELIRRAHQDLLCCTHTPHALSAAESKKNIKRLRPRNIIWYPLRGTYTNACVAIKKPASLICGSLRRSQRLMNGSRSISGAQLTKQNTMHASLWLHFPYYSWVGGAVCARSCGCCWCRRRRCCWLCTGCLARWLIGAFLRHARNFSLICSQSDSLGILVSLSWAWDKPLTREHF